MSLTPRFRFSPRTRGGKPTEGSITTTIKFELPDSLSGPSPSPEALALGRRLIDATRAGENLRKAMQLEMDQEFELDERDMPYSPEERGAAAEAVDQIWEEFSGRLLANLAEGYARRLSRDDLAAAVAFFESDVGRRANEASPLAVSDAAALSEPLFQQARKAMHARFCEKQPKSPHCYDPGAT